LTSSGVASPELALAMKEITGAVYFLWEMSRWYDFHPIRECLAVLPLWLMPWRNFAAADQQRCGAAAANTLPFCHHAACAIGL